MIDNHEPSNEIGMTRQILDLTVGLTVTHAATDQNYIIKRQIDYDMIEGISSITGRSKILPIVELVAQQKPSKIIESDLHDISPKDWEMAKKKYELIKPILEGDIQGRFEITEYAKRININFTTLYRWVRQYSSTNNLTSLLSKKSGFPKGISRLLPEQEAIIASVIQEFYLTSQRLSIDKIIDQVGIKCSRQKIPKPADGTIRLRIDRLSEKKVLRGRGQRKKADSKFTPAAGSYPLTTYPLEVIQIDHTPADVILVDDVTRKPIGRPWVTLAIDVHTRMVCGYYFSLDAPSETSVAMCIAHAVLPKENWLAAKGVQADWKVWGLPRKIHVDNGSDFRTETLKRACLTYNIGIEYRPAGRPHYGAHIERLIGTFMNKFHQISGTTFSNIHEKQDYDSAKYANMTFDETEKWFLNLIVKIYHKKIHSSLDMSPNTKWDEGIFGDEHSGIIGCGLPPIPSNPKALMLDFMPFKLITIQRTGVTWDRVRYYSHDLENYIGLTEGGKPRKYIFRRDPRDISIIYFFNPDTKQYIPISIANLAAPSISLWELKAAKQRLKDKGRKNYNEQEIIDAHIEMQQILDDAQTTTTRARRKQQRSKIHQKAITPVDPVEKSLRALVKVEESVSGFVDSSLITPFDDIG